MSDYNKNEIQALKDFNIDNFRAIPKDKILEISSKLHKLNPEVAKKVIEQFPTLVDGLKSIITNYKDIATKALSECSSSNRMFYEVKLKEMETLENELAKDNWSNDERFDLLDRISNVTEAIDRKNSEVQGMMIKAIGIAGTILGSIALGLISAFGPSFKHKGYNYDEEDEDD